MSKHNAVNQNQKWTFKHDKSLWKNRDCSVAKLADQLGRTRKSIRMRLEAIRDPKHNANQSLQKYYGTAIGSDKLKCKVFHFQYPRSVIKLMRATSSEAINKGKAWSRSDDVCLWNNRDCPVNELAYHHGRSNCSIRMRLELLMDPNSTPRQRLFGLTDGNESNKMKKRSRSEFNYDSDGFGERTTKRRKVEKVKIPEEYLDPVTLRVMDDPVLVSRSGYTYERATIMKCIRENGKDPFTRHEINSSHLVPNRALKSGIDRWKRKNM